MNLITFNVNEPLLSKRDKDLLQKEKNLYIGDWCLEEENIFSSKKFSYQTPENYHWDDYQKRDQDSIYLQKIYFEVLENLAKNLNSYHHKKYPTKYWELLTGRWLTLYLLYLFDRWEIIKSVFEENKINSTVAFSFDEKKFIPKNTLTFVGMFSKNPCWNYWVFSEIIKFSNKTKVTYIKPKDEIFFAEEKLEYINQINLCLSKNKFFFYNYNIPLKLKLKILLSNFQLTFKLPKKYLKEEIFNTKSRNLFYKYKNSNDNFLNFVNFFLIKNFPKIFLEEYENLEKIYENVLWPKNPNFIITTHSQFNDEIFKIYTAKNVLKGSKFLIAQHGGQYGIEKNSLNDFMEKSICDRFLTWGWKDNKKSFPLFMTTVHGKNSNKVLFTKKELMLVVYQFTLQPSRASTNMSLGFSPRTIKKRNSYILSTINFLETLEKNILNNVNINYKQKFLPEISRETEKKSILHKFPDIKFILGKFNDEFWGYKKEYAKKFATNNVSSKYKYSHEVKNEFCLHIETLFSSGFIEAMYLNRPVILLFDPIEAELNKDFLYYLKILKEENICFYNPKDAATFINKVYSNNNLKLWWESEKLQKVRKIFCDNFCRHSNNPVKDFQKSIIF